MTRPEALALAAALEGEPLQKAHEAAVEPLAVVDAARKALAKERQSIAGCLAAFWNSKPRGDPDDREREPVKQTEEVRAPKTALVAAEQAAQPFTQRVQYHEGQIAGLRAPPAPDPAILACLGMALVGGRVDAD